MKPTEATAAERNIYSTVVTGAVCFVAVLVLEQRRSLKLTVMATAAVKPRSNREETAELTGGRGGPGVRRGSAGALRRRCAPRVLGARQWRGAK